MPVFNTGKYIGTTLRSIMNQTYRQIEILVSDNASTDNSEVIVKQCMKEDNRIKYFKNEKNIGFAGNVNKLIGMASSDILAIYHADDIYEPSIVEKELKVLLNHENTRGVFTKRKEFFKEPGQFKLLDYRQYDAVLKKKDNFYFGGLSKYLPLFMANDNLISCPTFMTRKDIFAKAGYFSDKYRSNEDLDMWLRILHNGYDLCIIDEYLLNYRRESVIGSGMWRKNQELPVVFHVIDDYLLNYPKDIDKSTLKEYHKRKSNGYLTAAFNSFSSGNLENYKNNLILSKKEFIFKFISKEGLYQNFSNIFFNIKIIWLFLKNLWIKII